MLLAPLFAVPQPAVKVHVIPLGLDYDRIISGLQYYGVDKIYIIRGLPHPIEDDVQFYLERLKRRYKDVVHAGNFEERRVDIFDIGAISKMLYEIIEKEKRNQLHFALSSSTKLMSAYMLFAVWSRGEVMSYTPVIYYVDPKRYLHTEFRQLASEAAGILLNFDHLVKHGKKEEIRQFIKRVKHLSEDAKDGMTLGKSESKYLYEVPHIPVKAPSDTQRFILLMLKNEGGSISSINDLAVLYLERKNRIRSRHDISDGLMNRTRGRLSSNIEKLIKLRMVYKTRAGRKARLNLTELGEVFAG